MQIEQAELILKRVEQAREVKKARKDFLSFCLCLHKNLIHRDTEYAPDLHHRLIIEELQKAADNPRSKLSIAIPPGSGKSVYSSVLYPCWLLARNPKAQILVASYGDDLAHDFSRRRRSLMESEPWQRIANSSIDKKARSVGFTASVDGGSIKAVSASGSVTGHRADFLISDDLIVGHEQANSTIQLAKIWNWYLSEARTRMKPKASEVIIGTRWSVADPIGQALTLSAQGLEQWHHIRIPLLCDDPKNDPLGREMNELMWKTWFTPQHALDAQRDPLIFKTLFQQQPADDRGLWCPAEKIHRIQKSEAPQKLQYFIALDLALSIRSGDYTVMMLMALDDDRNLYVIDTWREQVSADISAQQLVDWCDRYHPNQILADSDNATKAWSRLVVELARQQRVNIPLRLVPHLNRGKEDRASNIRSYLMRDKVYFVEHQELNNVTEEVLSFPGGNHDDCVDCLSLAGVEFLKLSAPKAPRQANTVSVSGFGEGALQKIDGKLVLRTTLNEMFEDRERERKAMPTFMSLRL